MVTIRWLLRSPSVHLILIGFIFIVVHGVKSNGSNLIIAGALSLMSFMISILSNVFTPLFVTP